MRIIAMPPLLPVGPHPLPPVPPLRLLLFGFIRPYKGTNTAIEALAKLRADGVDAQLTIAGELWGDEVELRASLRSWQVEQAVDLRLGYVKDEDVDELFREHHIALAPYHSATQSGIIPLAMRAQRPVVATRVGGLAEQVQDGINGILVPPADATAFASAIQGIASDLDRFSESTRSSLPDWAHVAREVEELIG
jgi:glycosyltransferase involved in cell wall biosynthesis